MKKIYCGLVFRVALMIVSTLILTQAHAHHSAALLYYLDKELIVEGVVTKFSLGNPHARIYMTVKNENGEDEKWLAEGGSRTVLLRSGWTGDEIKPGDVVKILGHPSRDGSNLVHWQEIIFTDGSKRYVEDLNPYIIEDKRKNRRRK